MKQEFEWDKQKNQENVRKHKVNFETALLIFQDDYLCCLDERYQYDEDRWQAIGQVAGVILYVTYTIRGNRLRLISARKASKIEREAYYEYRYS